MLQTSPVVLRLPFWGRWIAGNSPANRIASHGTKLFGTTFAIDFVAVNERGHPGKRGWRSVLATESPCGLCRIRRTNPRAGIGHGGCRDRR